MPIDFWNYKVNPILGYYVKPQDEFSKKIEKKYKQITKGI